MSDKLAIIKTGGKQYIVSPGKRLKVEKLGKNTGENFYFGEVLLIGNANGESVTVGKPYLPSARVAAKVIVGEGRARKIKMLKYKPKKRYRRRIGHRQSFTEVEIESITS
ncbi:MAG: 50S ribosomal protein L21 [bacterium]|nr:50S ribosomal protein L21 [bacterium]